MNETELRSFIVIIEFCPESHTWTLAEMLKID